MTFFSLFVGGDLVSVKLHCPNGSPITADVEDNDDGTYTASFTPVSKGDHQITVHVRGKPIQGSSFDLQVWPRFDISVWPITPQKLLKYSFPEGLLRLQ